MNILFVSETYYPHLNGVYYFVCRIAPMLVEKGHKVAVIAPSDSIHFSKKKIDNLDVYVMPSLPVLVYPKLRVPIPLLLQSRIRAIINDFKPDVIHIQDHFTLSKAVILINKTLGIPVIATNHFMPENLTFLMRNEKAKQMLEAFMWSRFSKIFNQVAVVTTPTETGARLIRPRLKRKVVAVTSGIDLAEFTPYGNTNKIRETYNLPDKPILLYVGRLDPEKKIEEILQAVAIAIKQVDFYFVVVGKGLKKAALEELAKELGIEDNVLFTGFVPNEDLPYFYKCSHCFIIASTAELLSLVTLQAMASGLPVIAVKAGALTELVIEDVSGYTFKTGDIEGIAVCINKIFNLHEGYETMSAMNVEMSKRHNIHRTVDVFEKMYGEIMLKPVKIIRSVASLIEA